MDADSRKEYRDYIERTAEIRSLSSPSLTDIDNADDYARRLRENFERIGELAALNRSFLDTVLFPLIRSNEPLKKEEIREIIDFGDLLVDARSAESIDLPIVSILLERLLSEADENGDIPGIIRRMDARIGTLYGLMNITHRLTAYPEISDRYRKLGFSVGDFFIQLLQKKRFEKIQDPECRKLVLTDARYSIVFFEGITANREMCGKQLELLAYMLSVEEDPFYKDAVPDYDWVYFHFRVLLYYALAP